MLRRNKQHVTKYNPKRNIERCSISNKPRDDCAEECNEVDSQLVAVGDVEGQVLARDTTVGVVPHHGGDGIPAKFV